MYQYTIRITRKRRVMASATKKYIQLCCSLRRRLPACLGRKGIVLKERQAEAVKGWGTQGLRGAVKDLGLNEINRCLS